MLVHLDIFKSQYSNRERESLKRPYDTAVMRQKIKTKASDALENHRYLHLIHVIDQFNEVVVTHLWSCQVSQQKSLFSLLSIISNSFQKNTLDVGLTIMYFPITNMKICRILSPT